MSPQPLEEQKEQPCLNYIWVGPPANPKQGDIAGHDIACPKLMAENIKGNNKIRFWCLEQFKDNYREAFSGYPIEVCSIEKYLETDFSHPDLIDGAKKVKEILHE